MWRIVTCLAYVVVFRWCNVICLFNVKVSLLCYKDDKKRYIYKAMYLFWFL